MRVLGIDVGLKRTGLAMSDESGIAIKFLPNLKAARRDIAIEGLLSLINEFAIEAVVIGSPEPKTSGSIAISRRAHGLKDALVLALRAINRKVLVTIWDETDTSKRALAMLVLSAVPEKKRRALLDAASAAVLVEDFIATNKKSTDAL